MANPSIGRPESPEDVALVAKPDAPRQRGRSPPKYGQTKTKEKVHNDATPEETVDSANAGNGSAHSQRECQMPVDDMDSYSRSYLDHVGRLMYQYRCPLQHRVLGARQLANGKECETNKRDSRSR